MQNRVIWRASSAAVNSTGPCHPPDQVAGEVERGELLVLRNGDDKLGALFIIHIGLRHRHW
jgi:hypothetical protein